VSHIRTLNKTTKNGLPFSIRTAASDDAAAMLAYIKNVSAETPFFLMEADEFNLSEEQERAWIQEHADRHGWLALEAEAAGEVIGVLSAENGLHRRTAHRCIFGISTARPWRGVGVGTALLDAFLQWAEAHLLIEKVDMEVFATNEMAIRFYKKLGFVEEGVKRREVKLGEDRYVDLISMGRFV
jgi:RimJ/RimL family protein N-acetyltransferase